MLYKFLLRSFFPTTVAFRVCNSATAPLLKPSNIGLEFDPNLHPSKRVSSSAFYMHRVLISEMAQPDDNVSVGIIGMGDMGKLYAERIAKAGWK